LNLKENFKDITICVVGLGYVGLPLAKEFSKHFKVIGFDINEEKIRNLKQNQIQNDNFTLTDVAAEIKSADIIIIAVPTPITKFKEPDLSYIQSASKIVGCNIKRGSYVVLESTVYPGVTENIVVPIIEKESGFTCGIDFKIGYSPERITPGDEEHTIDKITKIVSAMDKKSTKVLAELYSNITKVYVAENIQTAEAAKVIENVQRDLNIALMNELSILFNKAHLDTTLILDAARTKWNFHNYKPGLVGGHCIPVDPYYLVHMAKELDYHPQVILAGRSINDNMSNHIVELTLRGLNEAGKAPKKSKILIMGLTYKENVSDTRETPVKKIIQKLKDFKSEIYGYDPHLTKKQIADFRIKPLENLKDIKVDCIIIAIAHKSFFEITLDQIIKIMNKKPVLIDVRGMFGKEVKKNGLIYMRL